MKAVLLCAGSGTRLGALTALCPKVMLPLRGKPLLVNHLEWLRRYEVREVGINLYYQPRIITDCLGDGSSYGVRVRYSHEPRLRGTAGALNGFRDFLDETFLVHYGDVYTEVNLARWLEFHRQHRSQATLVVQPTDRPHDSDIVVLAEDSRVTALAPTPGDERFGNLGNAASYLFEPTVLRYVPDQEGAYDFVRDVFPRMLAAGEPMFGYRTDEYMHDMGTPERYAELQRKLSSRPFGEP